MMIENELRNFPVVIYRQVQWGEMDVAKHVNNVVYLRWSATARIEYFRQMNLDNSFEGVVDPILAYQDIKYIFPVTYPDTVFIGTSINKIEADRMNIQCKMYSKKHQKLVAISNHITMAYNYITLSKTDIPHAWIEKINEIESNINE
jgi:acyl-CoA thioester hydrolase